MRTLAGRIGLATIIVAVIAVATASVVSMGLMQTASQNEGRKSLQKQADIVAALLTELGPDARPKRSLEILRSAGTPAGILGRNGDVRGHRWARGAIQGWKDELADGRRVSVKTEHDGRTFFVEGRPLEGGRGLILARVAAEITILAPTMLRQQSLVLLLGLAAAVAAGLISGRTIASPLTRAASAATAMAAGDRGIRVRPDGPREVADVARSLNTLVDALGTSEGRQREFLMSVSHELRTPLTAIKGFAESLADGVAADRADQRVVGQTILDESTRLERLIADLLDLARLRAEEFRLDIADVDLTAIMTEASRVWAARCQAVGVQWHAELPAGPLPTRTDAARVRQIVDGLIENALRVTPKGRPIVLALRPLPSMIGLEVRDGGPGLTPEDRAVAFDRSVLYERYRGVRKVGTGLGLALVHGLAVRLGGTAEVDVAPEGGALFRILLPWEGVRPSE